MNFYIRFSDNIRMRLVGMNCEMCHETVYSFGKVLA
jgi:hypothetical protein